MFGNKVGHLGRVGSLTLAQRVSAMFTRGEPGAWYDPSDLSTLFQDSAGTTPVTAVEQPVGRILDKSGRGNHATQATTTKRPVYSRRVNLLTKTEDYLDAAWIKTSVAITPNAAVAPDGTNTASLLVPASAAGARYIARNGLANSISFFTLKAQGLQYASFGNAAVNATINLNTGTLNRTSAGGMTFTAISLGDGWYRVYCVNPSATAYQMQLFAGVDSTGAVVATDGVAGIYVWGASLTLATDAHLPYQWVNTATDYDADPAKFPAYLRCDGVDDALQTGNIDFTSTDKMTVWAGMTNLSDATVAELVGLSSNPSLNGGRFTIRSTFAAGSVGRTWHTTGASMGTIASFTGVSTPGTNILTGVSDLAAPLMVARRDGIVTQTQTYNLGGGTFSNNPLYIGARNGTSNYFNGRLYSLIVRGAQTPLSQIEATELYIKQQMRMP